MSSAKKITAYVMTYNEAHQIREVLESIKWADEILLVDSFSTDGTVEIGKEYGAKIISEKFCGFGKLRNFAVDGSANDWMLSIDSDERCTPELAQEVRREVQAPAFDAYMVPRKNYFFGRWIRGCGWYPDYRQPQFFNRQKMRYREDLVHEGYELKGKLGYLKEHAIQYPWPNLKVALGKLDRYSSLMAERYAKENRRGSFGRLVGSPLAMFFKMYILKAGFRDGTQGFLLSYLYGYYTFLKYAKLWELHRGPGMQKSN
jgi:glycosyltransferase involved in cell wall biosynthesis